MMTKDFEKYFPLPWKAQCRGTWEHIDAENGKGCNICIIPATDYEPKKAARQYLVQCANLMPEAVELLGKCAREIQNRCDFCAGSYGRACIGCSNLETRAEIHALLAKLEGGMGE